MFSPSVNLPFDCQKTATNLTFFQKKLPKFFFFFFKKIIANDENFWQFFWKKCKVFGKFLTVKWQFSGGSDGQQMGQICDFLKISICLTTGSNHETPRHPRSVNNIWISLSFLQVKQGCTINMAHFKISFSTFWLSKPKFSESDFTMSHVRFGVNMAQCRPQSDIPAWISEENLTLVQSIVHFRDVRF